MNDYRVSVIIPTIGDVNNLRRSISSVFNQTYNDLEVIVVADKYDIDTVNLLEEYRQSSDSFRYILCENPVGGNEARNIGIRNAKYNWIALLDDDDEWVESKLEIQMTKIQKLSNNEGIIVCSKFIGISEIDGKKRYYPRNRYSSDVDLAYYLFGLKYGRNYGAIQTSTIVAHKKIFIKYPFDKELPKHQDWDWLLTNVYRNKIKIIQVSEYLSKYYISSKESVSKKNLWNFSYDWIQNYKSCISKKSYDSFLYSVVLSGILYDKNLNKNDKYMLIKKINKEISLKNKISIARVRFLYKYFKLVK